MTMTRGKIEESKAIAQAFVRAAEVALARLDREAEERRQWNVRRGEPWGGAATSASDSSFGSAETGALRRRSLDLTRSLAKLRKNDG